MAKDYLLYRLIVNVQADAETANDDSLVDEIAQKLYDDIDKVCGNVSTQFNVTIDIEEE